MATACETERASTIWEAAVHCVTTTSITSSLTLSRGLMMFAYVLRLEFTCISSKTDTDGSGGARLSAARVKRSVAPLAVPLSWLSVWRRDACDLRHVKVTHHWANIYCFFLIFESQMVHMARDTHVYITIYMYSPSKCCEMRWMINITCGSLKYESKWRRPLERCYV